MGPAPPSIMDIEKVLTNFVLPRLGNDNFEIWKFHINMELIRKGLSKFVTDPKPETPSADWLEKDGKARAFISATVEAGQLVHIMTKNTAKEM